jgi:PAS domain S-box-containing protein
MTMRRPKPPRSLESEASILPATLALAAALAETSTMTEALTASETSALSERVRELEGQVAEYEDTLGAIRRGEVDALVVDGHTGEPQIYTLASADRPYRVLIEQMQEGAVTLSTDGSVLYCNRCLALMLQTPQQRLVGHPLQRFLTAEDQVAFARLLREAQRGVARSELTLRTANDEAIAVYMSLSLLRDGDTTLLCGVLTDLTEQKLHLRELADANLRLLNEIAERERVEETLRQAQKMEAVGQLTGGLAHDFNNLLTSITGSLELLRTRVETGRLDDVSRYFGLAQTAADRAAALTHRLLAFSRRQALDPVPTSANRLIAGMEDLIRRTAGPAIGCESLLAADLWPTLCDPNQLENAVLNLAINARDAMPDGGTLRIETENVQVDALMAGRRDIAPGDFIVIRVTDTGIGMSPEVAARAFDPFFTTKPLGLGTGLGLSMIYGFARQSGGQAHIESQQGSGTTVRLFLPRHTADEAGAPAGKAAAAPSATQASESVLLVDDEMAIRLLVSEVLEEQGYTILEAEDGPSGLRILDSNARIDLLITDVGLPGGLNGRQVADAARARRPGLKVLFITGYADNAVVGGGRLEPGMQIMTKPFAMSTLATRVRSMLAQ